MFSVHPSPAKKGPLSHYWQGFKTTAKISPFITSRVWSPCIWKEGLRKEANFVQADWGALDFDDGRYSLEQAKDDWKNTIHLMGTTKNHQKVKNGGLACDRFRIVFPWQEVITDLRVYRWNSSQLVKRFGADDKCIDGARIYWPCSEVVSIVTSGVSIAVAKTIPHDFEKPISQESYLKAIQFKRENYRDGLPRYIHNFLHHGHLFGAKQSRNVCCYATAIFLFEIGYSRSEIIGALLDTPFSREDFKQREIYAAVASAEKSITRFFKGVSSNENQSRGSKPR